MGILLETNPGEDPVRGKPASLASFYKRITRDQQLTEESIRCKRAKIRFKETCAIICTLAARRFIRLYSFY